MPVGTTFPDLAGSHTKHVVGQGLVCATCHNGGGSTTANHGNSNGLTRTTADLTVASATAQFTFSWTGGTGKGTCSTVACHGTAEWGVSTFDCVSCHTATVLITKGSLAGQSIYRAAVAASLKSSGTRNHKSTAVGSDATKWDCIVCHMEGNSTTGSTDPAYHGNGVIDFRDSDTGTQAKKVSWSGGAALGNSTGGYVQTMTNFTTARFSRNMSVPLESDPAWLKIASIQMNLCLKCHDSDGAVSSTAWTKTPAGGALGTAMQPFGNAVASTATQYPTTATLKTAAGNITGAVMNVASMFDTTNASYHPVVGRQNNSYVSGSRLKAPWGNATKTQPSTVVYGYMISCFDCHAPNAATGTLTATVVAHGNGTTAAVPSMIAAKNAYTAAAVGSPNLCTACHTDNYFGGSNHATGSAFGTSGSSMTGTMPVCARCHGGYQNTAGGRASDAHGFNVTLTGSATQATSNVRPYSFFRVADFTWGAAGIGSCAGGCTASGTYTPAGVY
jgi:hypothetical protein